MIIQITFQGQLNESIQVGDVVYYVPTTANAGFSTSNISNTVELGKVTNIYNSPNEDQYTISVDYPGSAPPTIPSGSFYLFSKDNTVNLASVLGYYAEITFINNSNTKAEMFNVGSVVQLNSK